MLAWVLVVTLLPGASRAAGDIVAMEHDGTPYDVREDSDDWLKARQHVAQRFYATHTDSYDFLVVLPTFDASLCKHSDAQGCHLLVSNAVQGIGKPVLQGSTLFGSAQRLKGYIDLGGLRIGSPLSLQEETVVLAHEVAHQWSGEAHLWESSSSPRSEELLGKDGAHWSFFLDSEASVLYGSDWEPRGPASFESVAQRRRYSALDLYLMGFLSPQEVSPLNLLTPAAEEPLNDPKAIPPADGTRISATSRAVDIARIIQAEGARTPTHSTSQRQFRAAFIVLTPRGQTATSAQIDYADSLRRSFENHFFFLTRGQGVFETELVEQAPDSVTSTPGVELGLAYLLSRQTPSGTWGTTSGAALRETQQAMDALRLFLSSAGVSASLDRARSALQNRHPTDVDGIARLSLATQNLSNGALGSLRARLQPLGGVGLSPGYRSTLLDTALLGLALELAPEAAGPTPEVTEFLLNAQNGDGGWAALPGGPSRFEPTALVLDYLFRVPRTPAINTAVNKAFQFFHERYTSQGFMDEGPRAAATGWAVTALAQWRQLTTSEALGARQALLSRQRQDGGWEGSVADTALALRALRILLTPNLMTSAQEISLPSSSVMEGETVLATVGILNTGYARAENVLVKAFDSNGNLLGVAARLTSLEPGERLWVQVPLDTHNAAGTTQAFFVVDPNGEIDEGQESDNRAAVPFFVAAAPAVPDLFVQAGSVTVTPAAITHLPAQVTVSARVGNLGKTAVGQPVDVVARMGTQVLATSQVTLAAQSSQLLTWPIQLTSLQAGGVITVEVDPSDAVPEPVETNNRQTVKLGLTPGVDLRVAALTAPATVDQGHDITFSYAIANGGTQEAQSTGTLEVLSGSGATVATLPLPSQLIGAGGQATGQLVWRANIAGSLKAVLKVQYPDDLDPTNNTGSALFTVQASALPNLVATGGSLSITPEPPLETQPATVNVTIRNSGQSEAQGFTVDFYLGVPESGGTRFHREQVSTLAAGASLPVTAQLTLPRDAPKSLYVVLDGTQAVSEFDEDDNRIFVTLSPVPIADLVVSSAGIRPSPAFPRENTPTPVTVSVMNAGGQRAENIPVELLRATSTGSDESIGQAVIPAIEAGQSGEVVISWDTTGLRGPQKLVAVINKDQSVPEQRTDNNRGERQVSVQDAALALSEPYFSPNGDGIRDTTEISYRLAAEAPVEARIEDGHGNTVRILTAAAASASSLSWDGRSADGRIVQDGAYSIHVRTLAPAPEKLLGTLTAVVDTNRTLLDSSEPSSLEVESLQGLDSTSYRSRAAAMPDESGVVVFRKDANSGQCGLFHQPLGGAPSRRLSPENWSCDAYAISTGGLAVSPDARRVAFHDTRSCSFAICNALEILSIPEQRVLQVATDERQLGGRFIQSELAPVFSKDGARLYFVTQDQTAGDYALEEVNVDGTQRRVVARSQWQPAEFSLSPEGDRLAIVDTNGTLFLIRLPEGTRQEFLPYGTISGIMSDGSEWYGVPQGRDFRHGWAPSGEAISYTAPGTLESISDEYGGENIVPVAPRLDRKDLQTGGIQQLFAGTLHSEDFLPTGAAVAVNPVSGGTAFRYQPLLSTSRQIWTVSAAGAARMLVPYNVEGLRWSAGGSFLFGLVDTDGNDGGDVLGAVVTRDNLFVRLTATRSPSAAAMTFQGSAADLNFEEWQLGVRTYGSTAPFVTIAASATPVRNGLLTEWIPPAPGMYEAQLLAKDRAGNTRSRTVSFGYSLSPAVANLSRAPEYFSPNGDGVLDTTELRYTVTRATIADFQILDARNQVVLQSFLNHPRTGDFTVSWDGRDSNGQRVPDGVYTLSLDGTRLSVVVDSTPPVAQLALTQLPDGEGSNLPPPYQYMDILPRDLDPDAAVNDAARTTSGVRIVGAGTTWKIQDANLKEWAFEVSSPDDPSVSRPIFTGNQPVDAARPIPIELLRGSFRIRVKDQAGNQALTAPLQLNPARLFVTLGGSASQIDHSWELPGQIMPRVRPFTIAQTNLEGRAILDRVEGGWYAFGLNTTNASRLTSFSVAYRTPSGPWIVDSQNVEALGESMVVWDARSAGGISEVELRAMDTQGQTLKADVLIKDLSAGDDPFARGACVRTRTGEATTLSALVGDGQTWPGDVSPGSKWRFTAVNTHTVTEFPAHAGFLHKQKGLLVMETLPTASLSECQYTVTFLGTLLNGAPLVDQLSVNLCKPQVTVAQDGLSVSESFRQAIRSVDLFVEDHSREVVIARFGPFEGTSPTHPIDRSLFPDAPAFTLRARATLADGTRVVTQHNLAPDDPRLLDAGCNDEAVLELPRGALRLSSVARDGDAPLCGIQEPLYTSQLKGQGDAGQQLQALNVQLVTAQGELVAQPEVSGVVLGSAVVNASVRINSKTLEKGSYLLRASATWSDGEVSRAEEQPVFIDKTAAHVVITRPAGGGRVCPESRRGANGALEQYLVVEGAVSDDHLESYELLLGGPDGVPQRVFQARFDASGPGSVQGVLGTIDRSLWGDSHFELLLSARDVSGSSWCASPVAVDVATPPVIEALSMSPELFSPDGDGVLDTTELAFSVDQDVSYAVTTEVGLKTYTILQGQAPRGKTVLSWNGFLPNGSRLFDGDYPLKVRVTGACGMTGEASTLVRVDTTLPVARIDFPAEGQVLGGSFTAVGEASDVNLARYELSLGAGSAPTSYTAIVSAQTAISGVLGEVSLANLPVGAYTLRLVTEDKAGHSHQVLRRFQLQPAALLRATSVVPSLLSPDGDGIADTATLGVTLVTPATVSATLVDGAGQPLRTLVEPTSLPANTSLLPLAGAALQGLAEGVYTVRVTAASGSNTEEAVTSLEIDVSAPRVQLGSPVAGSIQGASLTVRGTIDDTHLESWTLTHLAPRESTGRVVASGSAPASGLLTIQSGLIEGTHQLVLKASDRAGHAQEQRVSFTVDTTPPAVSFLSPTNGGLLSGSTAAVEIRGQAEDAHLRSVSLEAHTIGGTQTLFSGPSVPPDGLLHLWSVGYESDGPAELHLKAEDEAGNTSESLLSFVLDSTPPRAALTEPRGANRGEGLAFRGSATDANLSRWELELGRGTSDSESSFQQIASGSQPISSGVFAALASVGDGSYIARLRVRDSAGNESVDQTSFTVDSLAPLPAPALSATVERPNTVTLTWEPSPSSDVTAYDIRRADGSGSAVVIATVGPETHAYKDSGLSDGRFRYSIVARDAAGNASNPSPEALVEIDSTPPMVSWLAPTAGEQVRGTIELQGTAYSQSDFREYRVSLGAGGTPTAFTLLTHSMLPVSAGRLGELVAKDLPQGSIQTLRLEAEDLIGNVSEARVTFTVDNQPPLTPTLTSATVSGSNVSLAWQATAEEDLLGFVLFRDGAPLGTPGNESPQDLRPYALPASSRSFQDLSVPDGRHTYSLVAIDRAGNISAPSTRGPVVIETRAPVARIVEPGMLERLRQDTWLVAQSDDQDISSISFESRATPTGSFTAVGEPVTHVPFTVRLPLSQFGRVIELRAVAKDSSSKVDAAPASIHVLNEAVPSKPSATALVDGDQVEISWTDTNPAGLLTGFELTEAGEPLTRPPLRWPGTASATSTSSGTPQSAYDDAGTSTSWVPRAGLPQAWTLTLTQPVMLRGLSLVTTGSLSHLRLEARIAGFWVPLAADVLASPSTPVTHSLDRPVEVEALRVTFLSMGGILPGLADVQLDALPLEHGRSTVLSSVAPGPHTYRLRAMGFGGTPSEATDLSINVYAPTLEPEVAETPESTVKLRGSDVPASAQVEVFNESGVLGTATADAQGHFTFTAPLVKGDNFFQARATDGAGNHSLPSEPVTVVCDPAPSAGLTLALSSVTESDVSLSLSVAGDTADVAGFVLVRDGDQGPVELPTFPATARSFIDRGVRNGTYTYRVQAFNARGFRGPASNAVTATVAAAPPAAPVDVAVEPLPSGGALSVSWAPGDARTVAYRVERAVGANGPFEVLAGAERLLTPELVDLPLTDSTLYRYRILAVDALGNLSSPSLIVTGVPVDSTPPAPPRLLHPTVAGKPVTVSSPTVAISGLTEPGTKVTLLRNGVPAAETGSGALTVESVPLELSLAPKGSGWASADGQLIAYVVKSSATAPPTLAVQTRTGELLGTFGGSAFSTILAATFSPDGGHVAIEAISASTYHSEIHIADLATGNMRKAGTGTQVDERSATWSPDSRELAYEVEPSSKPSSLVVVDTVAGTERSLTGADGAPLMAPRYAPGGSSLFALTRGANMQLLRMDPVSGASAPLFEATSIERDYVVSPDSGRIALVATRGGQKDLHTVSVSTGASVQLTHGQELEKTPAFSRDGRRLAFVSGSFLVVHEDGREQRFNGFSGLWLSWTQEGTLLTSTGVGLARLDWGAKFEFTGVRLEPGPTAFSATATDAAQRTGLPAAPIQITLDATTLPDLVAEVELRPEVPRMGHPFDAFVTVRNQGGGAAPATTVSVAVLSPDGQSITPQPISVPALAAGGVSTAVVPLSHPTLQGPQILEVIVDPEQRVEDPVRDNNRVRYPFSLVLGDELRVALSVSPQTVDADGNSLATLTVSNPGTARNIDVEARLLTEDGESVLQLGEVEHLAPLETGRSRTFTRPVLVGRTLAGTYQVKAVVRQGTEIVTETSVPFTINADRAALLRLAASHASYGPGEPVALTATVRNDSRNSFLEGASYVLTVTDEHGNTVQGQTIALPLLTQGTRYSVNTELAPAGLAPGRYEAHGVVMLGSLQLAVASANFSILGSPRVLGTISVLGQGTPPGVPAGRPLTVTFDVGNVGTAPEPSLVLRVAIIDAETQQTVDSYALSAQPIEVGGTVSGQHDFSTSGLPLRSYAAYLLAERPDGTVQELSSTSFRLLDSQPPTLRVINLVNGQYLPGSVDPLVQAIDPESGVVSVYARRTGERPRALTRVSGTAFDGNWSSDIGLWQGKYSITFGATDAQGNTSELRVIIIVDRVPPEVTVTGVTDGALLPSAPTPVVGATDANLASVSSFLDGQPFTSGTAVESEGRHELVVQAVDLAGNQTVKTLRFTVDTTPPTISVSGVTDGGVFRQSVTPVVTIRDRDLLESSILLDDQPFVPGTVVTAEGSHTLRASAKDRAGNPAERQVTFTLDQTPPALTITGVSEGSQYSSAVTPVIDIQDAHLSIQDVRLNGVPYVSGTSLATDGSYTLTVHAEDLAGWVSDRTVRFSLHTQQVNFSPSTSASFTRVLALVRAGTCTPTASELQRVQGLLDAELGGPERLLTVVADEAAFLESLRAGVANVVIVFSLGSTGSECGETLTSLKVDSSDAEALKMRKAWSRELTEQVFAGHTGLVVIRSRSEDMPLLREVLGVGFQGTTQQSQVQLPSSALQGPAYLSIPGGGVVLQALEPSVQPAATWSGSGEKLSGALYSFGQGRSVTFGVDLSSALPAANAALSLSRSVAYVLPTLSEPAPLGVMGVELRLTSPSRATRLHSVETLPPAITALWASSQGTLAPGGHGITWEDSLEKGTTRGWRFLVRLPEDSGSHTVSASATSLQATEPRDLGAWSLAVEQPLAASELLARVRTTLEPLREGDPAVVSDIEARLRSVEAREITQRADIEAHFEDLFGAIEATRHTRGESSQVRKALGDLLQYWEARWYLL